MEQVSFHRKLTAILSADVVGYTRLMQDNEAATVQTLQAYKQIIADLVKKHFGQIVDSSGDNLLAKFASVVNAVQCAVEVQKEIQTRNAELPENRKMRFRIGVNLGDVIEEGACIYGDGVNIAARLESLADPGGICVSKTTFDQIEDKFPYGYAYIGEQNVKNISKPIGAYKLIPEPQSSSAKLSKKKFEIAGRRKWVFAGIAAVIVIIGAAMWNFYWGTQSIEPASREKMAFPLPEMPSLAVLPFANKSDDPKMELFCDGVTDNIITALSKFPQIMVIARSSVYTYRGHPAQVKQASEGLGVQYVLEGSVQKSGNRIRITAHLFDALKGAPVWGDTYDRDLTDIFALQDEIVMKVLYALRVNLTMEQPYSLQKYFKYFKGQQGLDCYLKLLQASEHISRWNLEDINLGRRLVEESLAMCPDSPGGILNLGWYYHHASALDTKMSPEEAIKKSIELAHKAIDIDDSISGPYSLLCSCHMLAGDLDKAIPECERAVSLNPGSMDSLSEYGWTLAYSGRYQEAIQVFQKIIRRNPFARSSIYRGIGMALLLNGQLEEALSAFKSGRQRSPNDIGVHVLLAITYSMLGRDEDVAVERAEVLRLDPKYSIKRAVKRYAAIRDPAAREKLTNELKKTGLPEKAKRGSD
jgi:adenylate cyclase